MDRDLLLPHQVESIFLLIRSYLERYCNNDNHSHPDPLVQRAMLRLISATISSCAHWVSRILPSFVHLNVHDISSDHPSESIPEGRTELELEIVQTCCRSILQHIPIPDLVAVERRGVPYAWSFHDRILSKLLGLIDTLQLRRDFIPQAPEASRAWDDLTEQVESALEILFDEEEASGKLVLRSAPVINSSSLLRSQHLDLINGDQ